VIRSALFLAGSIALAAVSRGSLRVPGSHGFFRFFAWEAMLGTFVLVLPRWFDDPFSLRQLASWLLLFGSIPPAVEGARLLHRVGRPTDERADPTLYRLERTSSLVTTGLYRWIRHPLYASLMCLALGVFLKAPTLLTAALTAAAVVFLVLTSLKDEEECIRYFGPAYEEYMRTTKRFIPFVV
jgi:protein-S-isoprenylcysteine O-methyltransferase Ste14